MMTFVMVNQVGVELSCCTVTQDLIAGYPELNFYQTVR